jgi:dipeptidyl aminopeptidase/acylaminoacyl peptidase
MQGIAGAAPHFRHEGSLTAAIAELARQPGGSVIVSAADLQVLPDRRHVSFTATVSERLDAAVSRLAVVPLAGGSIALLSPAATHGRLARWSGDGRSLAYLSKAPGMPESLVVKDRGTDHVLTLVQADGAVESLQWSHDSERLLVGLAGHAADKPGVNGGAAGVSSASGREPWMPNVDDGNFEGQWRTFSIASAHNGALLGSSPPGLNVWESVWAGHDHIAALVSDEPGEDAWYRAHIVLLSSSGAEPRQLYRPKHQLSSLAVAPTGHQIAVAEALASDRLLVAGVVVLIETASGRVRRVAPGGIDVTQVQWVDDDSLMLCGLRGQQTVLARLDLAADTVTDLWLGPQLGLGQGWYPECAALDRGHAVAVVNGFVERPCLALLGDDLQVARTITTLGSDAAAHAIAGLAIEVSESRWRSGDGLEITGWRLQAGAQANAPTAVEVHGGPVWQTQPRWLGDNLVRWGLLKAGYALLLANPRGSTGRGHAYAAAVYSDIGGADAVDVESGIDALVASGLADPHRLYCYGVSYGGYMAAWLVTRSDRFAAVAACSPVSDWVSQHLCSHAPSFCANVLADQPDNPGGRYFTRSPIHFAGRVRTPVLLVCGERDRNTLPAQALAFHQALRERRATSVLVSYPQEGHAVRGALASIDFANRVLEWFDTHRRANANEESR